MNDPTDEYLDELMGGVDDAPASAVDEAQGVIRLDPPVHDVERLELKEPSVFQVLEAARVMGYRPTVESIYDSQIELVAKVAGCSTELLRKVPTRKLDRAVSFITAFEANARRRPDQLIDGLDLSPSCEISFKEPIKGGGRSFTLMTLREPRVEERRRYKAGESLGSPEAIFRAEIRLVEDVSEWTRAAVLRMPISQFAKAADYLTGFFIDGQ
ncbi:phage tail assembly protein [Acetobacter estunensis]|uniref:phage tail assembly protein n=1 Tax=Acetobacter estunensis TaxID=104097 RepID=UPI001C2DE8C9|nr:phage tail assembly protein [Acetobacter estunensis]MBV1835657.1 phage tail assembly protein [Acetobacter estunensis]MBV1836082.1 phage tail assembly protein [Acetobacter estunensis]